MLDVTAKDAQGVQILGETKIFNMIGYTEKNLKGEKSVDNWLIRSWEDKALQPGKTEHVFKFSLPQGVRFYQVQAVLTYQVGDSITPMTQSSRQFSVPNE
ncbi:MAG: hypothetical protein HY645_01430 [Acidobacteria bacterium]|nr:hypothetical protein [Acidobacteriota bacterium]